MNKKVFLDCTHTYNSGLNTGIQRVVKNIVKNVQAVSRDFGVEIIPIVYYKNQYKTFDNFPKLADSTSNNKYKLKNILKKSFSFFRGITSNIKILNNFFYNPKVIIALNSFYENFFTSYNFSEKKIKFSKNDILLFIDSTWLNNKYDFYKSLKNDFDIKIVSIIYDLIPINQKEFCSIDLNISLIDWFDKSINIVDKYICISKSVENECFLYIKGKFDTNISKEKFDYFYLGANIKDSDFDAKKIENDYKKLFETNNVFITVSTIEPRKNHKYILDAFEKLWEKNVDVKYIIIGKIGWKVEDFIQRIQNHKEFNKRLFLLENVDDEHLLYAYKNSKALIFASFIEGFGLPIIESLYNKLQVLASNIEIHREIGKDKVSYFDLDDTNSLVELIQKDDFNKNIDDFKWISWEESTKQLINKVLEVK